MSTKAPLYLLNQTIAVLRRVTGEDGAETWPPHLASIRTRVRPSGGGHRRYGSAQRSSAVILLRFYVERRHDITLRDRIVYAGVVFRILEAMDWGSTFRLLLAEEVIA